MTSPFLRICALLYVVLGIPFAASHVADAQGVLIPVANRQGMVFEHSGNYLYVAAGDGSVGRLNLTNNKTDATYSIGRSLTSIDIAPDDSFLLVVEDSPIGESQTNGPNSILHKLDLRTGQVSDISISRMLISSSGNGRVLDIAITSNGTALVSTADGGNTPLLQLDLLSSTISVRSDVPTLSPNTSGLYGATFTRSADGRRVNVSEALVPNPSFVYDAQTNSFGPRATHGFSRHNALNRDGSLVATGIRNGVALDTSPDHRFVHAFSHLGSGVAFSPVSDVLYAISNFSDEIIAFDTISFAELFRVNLGESVEAQLDVFTGVMAASGDGRHLAVETRSGVRVFLVPPDSTSKVTPLFSVPLQMAFDHAGNYLYITTLLDYVWPYNLRTKQLETPYYVGGSPNGVDIALDDSFLLVTQFYHGISEGTVHKIDLRSRQILNLTYPLTWPNEIGSLDIAIGSNGVALFTSDFDTHGANPVRQIDLATGFASIRADATGSGAIFGPDSVVRNPTYIYRSADGTRLALFDAGTDYEGTISPYDAKTNTFGNSKRLIDWAFAYGCGALSRDGTKIAWQDGGNIRFWDAIDLHVMATVKSPINSGIAFDAVNDVLYGVDGTANQLVALDASTFAEKFRISIGEEMPDFAFPHDLGSLQASQDGKYLALITPSTVRLIDVVERTVTAVSTPIPTPSPSPTSPVNARLLNISTRMEVLDGDKVLIAGFIVTGPSPIRVIVRGIGPSLPITGVLADPALELHDGSTTIATNDNWKINDQSGRSQEADVRATGIPPSNELESVVMATLPANNSAYTVVMRGNRAGTGIGLVEVYDLAQPVYSQLANISTRGFIDKDDNVMIGGFIAGQNPSARSQKVLLRAIGPSLPVSGALQDPTLELHNGNGTTIATNDNWKVSDQTGQSQEANIRATGVAPANDLESAILQTITPGNYTAVVRGKGGTIGVGLVEAYNLQ